VDPDPPRPLKPVDHEGRRVSDDLHVATIAFGLVFMRGRPGRKYGRRETIGELVYDVAQQQVAEQGLPHKAIGRWFPYVATLMLFIFTVTSSASSRCR